MALLRSAARALRLRRQQGCLVARRPVERTRPLSSSAPTERHKCFPSSDTRSKDMMELKRHINEKKEDIYHRLSTKIDKISDGLDEHARLLQELEVQIKNNNKHSREINFTPVALLGSASLLSFVLYKYVQG